MMAMMAMSKKILEQEPSEIEMLLPWHAAGTLNARDGPIVAGRRDRRDPDEEPGRLLPDRVIEHERACHPQFEGGHAAARPGAVCAGRPRRRYHGTAGQLSGLDHRWRQGRPVSAAIRQQGDDERRNRQSHEQAARREDRQSCGGRAVGRDGASYPFVYAYSTADKSR